MALASVRPATPEDVGEIVRIQTETWRLAYRDLVGAAAVERLGGPAARQAWTTAVRATEGGHHVWVATEGAWTVGFCAAAPADPDDPLSTPAASGAAAVQSDPGGPAVPGAGAPAGDLPDPVDPTRAGYVEIAALLVEPRWGRRGHGRRLLAEAFEVARRDGAERGQVWVAEGDGPSRACFDRIGWDADGLVRVLDAGDRELREIRLTGPLEVGRRDPRTGSTRPG